MTKIIVLPDDRRAEAVTSAFGGTFQTGRNVRPEFVMRAKPDVRHSLQLHRVALDAWLTAEAERAVKMAQPRR